MTVKFGNPNLGIIWISLGEIGPIDMECAEYALDQEWKPSFVVKTKYRCPDEQTKVFASLPPTVPYEVAGTEQVGDIIGTPVETTWSVPTKFHRLTRIRVWKSDVAISGFEVQFTIRSPGD